MITNNYINERIRNPTIAILCNGKEIKRVPFIKQAKAYAKKHNSKLWNMYIEIIDLTTGEIIGTTEPQ